MHGRLPKFVPEQVWSGYFFSEPLIFVSETVLVPEVDLVSLLLQPKPERPRTPATIVSTSSFFTVNRPFLREIKCWFSEIPYLREAKRRCLTKN